MLQISKKMVILKKLAVMMKKMIHLRVKIPMKALLQKGNRLRSWKKIVSSRFKKEMNQN